MSDIDSTADSPVPGFEVTTSKLVTVVLLPAVGSKFSYSSSEKRHALIHLADSYKGTVDAALKALGHYMTPSIIPDNVELLFSEWGDNGYKVWVEFDPADWSSALRKIGTHIAIREVVGREATEKTALALPASSHRPGEAYDQKALGIEQLVIGHVGVTYGSDENGRTIWTSVIGSGKDRTPAINRPGSYQEAIRYIKAVQTSQPNVFCPGGLDFSQKLFKFHTFVSKDKNGDPTTALWVDIPENAHTDEMIWRRYVPKPFEILGFTLQADIQIQTEAGNSTEGK